MWDESLLQRYAQYAREKMLPRQRQEFYLAQLSHLIAVSNGADCKITDFLLDYKEHQSEEIKDVKKPKKAPNPFFKRRPR
jgi:hypothetical protein